MDQPTNQPGAGTVAAAGATAADTPTPAPAETAKTLTFVVPAYNMETYLERCVASLLSASDTSDIEVLIVDDGSHDATAELADLYERRHPGIVRAIHQPNKGHGGAVNTGIAAARGMYVKVVDADDWVDTPSFDTVMDTLRAQRDAAAPVDMVVANYVYDKVGKRHKHTVNFRHAMQAGRTLGWDDLGRFGIAEYILMHALIYRTQVVRDSGMTLPEHTFYVDFIYAYQPFPWVRTMLYLDVPFYHYFIGRDGQSVQTDVMIRRVDQLLHVNRCMVEATPERGTVPDGLYRYMIHFLAIESSVTSVFLILSKDKANYRRKDEMWAAIDAASAGIGQDVRRKLVSRALNLRGSVGRWVIRRGYTVAEHVVGFN
ncbi:glycosyltransferase family 2 protein [Bifidobacterium leontopitheci]|nr:glycosyltransferase family 2 protein [Bifidobacterium leontopitheci]